jgi:hypothetical protein
MPSSFFNASSNGGVLAGICPALFDEFATGTEDKIKTPARPDWNHC